MHSRKIRSAHNTSDKHLVAKRRRIVAKGSLDIFASTSHLHEITSAGGFQNSKPFSLEIRKEICIKPRFCFHFFACKSICTDTFRRKLLIKKIQCLPPLTLISAFSSPFRRSLKDEGNRSQLFFDKAP